MAEKKRKTRDEHKLKKEGGKRMRNHLDLKTPTQKKSSKKSKRGEKRRMKRPSLPNVLQKEVEILNSIDASNSDEEINSDDANDVYEYEEAIPEEESKKNCRYDPVDNFEYKLPKQFEAEKLHTKTLPYPYTSKELFEHSIRMPIGPEFNPTTAIGALNRPEVVKKSGVIIKPIKFEELNPH